MQHEFDDAINPRCVVCGQHEHLSTTDCPGREVFASAPPSLLMDVMDGRADFVDGQWVHLAKEPALV